MTYKFYTLNNQFIEEANIWPTAFTGIIIWPDGAKSWHVDGWYHRIGGPAWHHSDGAKSWYVDGSLHRLDGPAYEGGDRLKLWFIDNKRVSKEQCELLYSIMRLKGLV